MKPAGPDHNYHPKYRPDIDGLRAVAVLSVVAFHAFPGSLPGGFVGVDIFFVISGFLISSILFRSLEKGEFSLAEFYAHRVKRIFPALIVVMLAVFAFGYFALLADELRLLGKHMYRSALFLENFLLNREAGYFDVGTELKPLMHLWSLGVEEQFYIVYPLILWAAWRLHAKLPILVALIALVSFGLNIAGMEKDPVGTFFLPHTRFWELMAGGLLAWVTLFAREGFEARLGGKAGWLAFAGLALIALPLALLDKTQPFPGWWALAPVLGAVAVIAAGPSAWLNRHVLGHKAMVFVGLISYPLYLWHWPLLSYAQIMEAATPAFEVRLAAVALTFVLAWLTYRLVERPFRYGRKTWVKTAALCVLMLGVGFLGYHAMKRHGYPDRPALAPLAGALPDSSHLEFHGYVAGHFPLCTPESLRKKVLYYDGMARCAQTNQGQPTVALIGDSHGEHLFIGLAEALKGRENLVYYLHKCLPFQGLTGPSACDDMDAALGHIASDPAVHTVILANHWFEKWQDPNFKLAQPQDGATVFETAMARTLETLLARGKRVYLVADEPNFPMPPSQCAPRPLALGQRALHCTVPRAQVDRGSAPYLAAMDKVLARFPGVTLLRTTPLLCDAEQCAFRQDGRFLYRDSNHLSVEGSQRVGRALAARIAPAP